MLVEERSGQFLRKEVSALPRLPLHSSSIMHPGLHHSTPQMSLWSSSPWDVYGHTIHFSTQKINGHAAALQVWKCIPLRWDKPTWNQVLPHDDLQGLKTASAKNMLLPGYCFFFRNCKMEEGGKPNFKLKFWWFGCLIYFHIYDDQVITPVFTWCLKIAILTTPLISLYCCYCSPVNVSTLLVAVRT